MLADRTEPTYRNGESGLREVVALACSKPGRHLSNDELMAFAQSPKAKRSVEEEQRRDRAAHREIVRLNRARGVAANLEDALRLHRGGDFRTLTDLGILG